MRGLNLEKKQNSHAVNPINADFHGWLPVSFSMEYRPMPWGRNNPYPSATTFTAASSKYSVSIATPMWPIQIFPGIPPVEKCLHCHNYIIAQHPWIQEEHRYFNTGSPTPWEKVNYVAEHVLFNHQRHINKKIACQECHGQVQNQQRLPAKIWRMGVCVECHQEKGANLDCWLACHS